MSFQTISIAFFAALKVPALSEIILLGFPLLAINLQNASRKCSAVISSTTSKCTARTAMQVNRHIHTFFRISPCFDVQWTKVFNASVSEWWWFRRFTSWPRWHYFSLIRSSLISNACQAISYYLSDCCSSLWYPIFLSKLCARMWDSSMTISFMNVGNQ